MNEEILLGIDIGTSSCKVAAFNKKGEVIDEESGGYSVYYPQKGWAQQNPLEWWQAVVQAVRQIIKRGIIKTECIKGIGIAGQSWSTILLDENGQVLTNTPIWMDQRSVEICQQLERQFGKERFFEISGNPLKPTYSLPKILWFKENRPDIYQRTTQILQSNSYIAYQLTGVLSQDKSQGYGLHFFNMRSGTYDFELCKELGLDPNLFPPLFDCHDIIGETTEQASLETGLPVGISVVAGGLDAACGTLGAGVIHNGQTQEQGGQAGGMSICLDHYQADERLILSYHVVPEKWLLQGGTVGGAGVAKWMLNQFYQAEETIANKRQINAFSQMEEEIITVPAGSEGVIFLPYMSGERSPIWDPDAKGVYYGLDFSKTKAHFLRAAYEGVAYALKHNLAVAEQAGAKVKELHAMGGAANSLTWTQIKADVTGKRIVVPATDTATTFGAAILAGVATSVYKSFEEAVTYAVSINRIHEPNFKLKKVYTKGYERYLAIYENLKMLMRRDD